MGVKPPELLRQNRAFRLFWTGQTVSLVGDQVTLLALPLTAVLVLHADAATMGYLTAAALAPNLLVSLHAGAWVDRRGRRRQTMIATDLGRALVLASIPVAYWLGAQPIAQLVVVGFAEGTLTVLFGVSYSTLLVSIVPRRRYVEANQLTQGARAASGVGGQSVAGFLVQLLGAPVALVVDAASFVVSALFLGRVRAEEPPPAAVERGHLAAGARFIRRSPLLTASLGATATVNFFNFVFYALFVLYATRSLHVRPGTLGLVLGAGAVGAVIGSLVTGRLARRIGIGPAFMLGTFLFAAGFVLVPLAGGPRALVLAMLFAAEFVAGFGVMILDIAFGSIQQALVPDRMRARVSGAYNFVNKGTRPLGSLAGGLLGSAIGLRPTLWIAVVGGLASVLFLLPSPMPRLLELPEAAE
ncbi:MAG: MFS transporter [Gaiellaceae bacterium]